jgi:hypothetical protein
VGYLEDEAGQRSLIESAASRFQLASRRKHSSILTINERNRTSSIARSRSAVIRMFFLHGSQRTLFGFAASRIPGRNIPHCPEEEKRVVSFEIRFRKRRAEADLSFRLRQL